ncbi:hypothetical protein ASPZODRAFT_15554 [Penicilliopsis zonata CBS 506.65]|uniref:Uncharacterized protein n=1 Tax=Penicilliopsis zonata CBS 506.65 TaxID=1073090 RepID=A0A1L9SIK1_9EURO|nr:hypothetical protein ASPZODRAFT_15554 [Penicilliopsis zonata CBS 506.65]OJJ46864.1 hypothetical protein ASPZODRAFT_15554 [Penicilliopsis zonata CBS 506.65]
MAGLSQSAIIVIIIICCLAAVCIAAAVFRNFMPADHAPKSFDPPREQEQYMRTVRMRNYSHLHRESVGPRDLESQFNSHVETSHEGSSAY